MFFSNVKFREHLLCFVNYSEIMSLYKKSVFVVLLVLAIDQIVKIWVKTHMSLSQDIEVFSWFHIHFVENPGMAFGMEFAGHFGKIFLSLFRIVAVSAIGYYLYRSIQKGAQLGFVICVSLVLAGAIGNIIDSAVYGLMFDKGTIFDPELNIWIGYNGIAQISSPGYAHFLKGCVVDMFHFPMIEGVFPDWLPFVGGESFQFFRPVFNVADSAISVGIVLIIIFQRRFFKTVE